jgi:hypothetical protein
MNPIPLGYRKVILPSLQDDKNIEALQSYNPIYSLFFDMHEANYNKVCFEHSKYIADLNHIVKSENPTKKVKFPMYIKYAPLIDPIHYLIGKYNKENKKWLQLPQLHSTVDTCMKKVLDYNNTCYVDTFFNYLSSRTLNDYKFYHGIDFFGSFLAIQKKFLFNAYDDIDYLRESDYFLENDKVMYELDIDENEGVPTDEWPIIPENAHKSYNNRPKLMIQNNENSTVFSDFIDDDANATLIHTQTEECDDDDDMEIVYEIPTQNKDHYDSDSSSLSYSTDADENKVDSEEEEEDGEDGDEEDGEDREDGEDEEEEDEYSDTGSSDSTEILPLYIYDFPIQMIAIEKCENTFDDLLNRNMIQEDEIISALLQIIFTLIAYQKMFDFTHNDLHTNNIVYKSTHEKFLYYQYNSKWYKVPTFGRIYKIIDFGRSIYRFQNKLFCSDSFAPGGDAHGQYNTEPFLDENKARIEPNKSFDLCRLGCSMYNFIFTDNYHKPPTEMTPVEKLVHHWCLDDQGVNILYKKNGDERYPNFKLYKMIARLVHHKQPESELASPIFSSFSISNSVSKSIPKNSLKMNIDALPKCWVPSFVPVK